MKLFSSRFNQAQARLVKASALVVSGAVLAGCGAGYRPVISPINPSGPAPQPTSLVAVVSTTTPTTPGVATIIDYAGDTIMATSPIGPGPTSFTIDQTGSNGYTVNTDGTLTNFPVSTTLQQKNVEYSTLPSTAKIVNLFSPSTGLWAADLTGDSGSGTLGPAVDLLAGFPATFKLSIPVSSTPLMVMGTPLQAQRNYAIVQGIADSTGVACNVSPRTAASGGRAEAIETATFSVSASIPVGKCPVYAVPSPDSKRLFVLNRGDDTITVINSQNNTLNQCTPFLNQAGRLVTCHSSLPLSTSAGLSGAGVPAVAGPVYAEYNAATFQLVVADYDGGTVSVIDVSLDEFGNDGPNFGTTFTIPVGTNPASVTVLNDGSRAYTANQADGTVSVVNLTSHTPIKTLAVNGHPRTVASTQNSLYGKVYVASPDSPYLTIVRTDQDIIDATVLVQGNIVDVRTTTQDANRGNNIVVSRKPGFGQPCNLPPTLLSNSTLNSDPAACSRMP
jgi:YVTN family beta-propeller protein